MGMKESLADYVYEWQRRMRWPVLMAVIGCLSDRRDGSDSVEILELTDPWEDPTSLSVHNDSHAIKKHTDA